MFIKKISRQIQCIRNVLMPRYCVVCGRRLNVGEGPLCVECNLRMPRLMLFRDVTDSPFALQYMGKTVVERAAAFVRYQHDSDFSRIIRSMKYENGQQLCDDMVQLMMPEALPSGIFEGIDGIVPVPLTSRRTLQRGFNQSELIANAISRHTGIPVIRHALIRIKFDESQTFLSLDERDENIRGAFVVVDPDALRDRHVLLVDDIVTTGATTTECANAILTAPNSRVSILAMAWAH